jgi:protein TonB
MMGKNSEAPAGASQPTASTPAPVAAPAAVQSDTAAITTDTATSELIDPEAVATEPGLDQELIDEEVQRRLQAERDRLDRQRESDLAAKPAPQKPTPRQQTPPKTTPPPPPATTPAPAPATETAVAETPPPPPPAEAPQEPVKEAVKEGDLVVQGTPGLVPPSLSNFRRPVYPPLAKRQRVEGIVVVQVLISEKGKVLEAKILRGVGKNVGIDEAALEAIKRSSFIPATLDGVKVKSHFTMTVPFKL